MPQINLLGDSKENKQLRKDIENFKEHLEFTIWVKNTEKWDLSEKAEWCSRNIRDVWNKKELENTLDKQIEFLKQRIKDFKQFIREENWYD